MSTDRHDPLDADERELARVLRALPAGEPPSALDARILAMARDAVVTTPLQKDEAQPRARRAPRIAWGFGVAASCVFAAGLVWRMGGFGTESFDLVGTELREDVAPSAANAEADVQPAAPLPPAPEEHISVEIGVPATPARALAPPPPPPPPPPMEAPTPQAAVASAPAAPPPAPAAPPAPPAPAAPAAAAPEAVAEPRAEAERAREQATMRMAPEPAALESISVFGSRVRDVQAATVVTEDSSAGPQTWIQRIRERIDRGDTLGARQSLEGFMERYPRKPLPQDLIDFGKTAGVDGLSRDDG
ncbi:hypothetical protein [Silanimonas sp.]|uniref:hypothetical protein n=1 Tax=Silanimonas sp. TaxID=1929290 RepID=UPI0022BAF35B|nr:hypothetical protein [Silanimonas sp.]MCZ8166192.1 hypothetical protein [Silanimonas sp.]